MNTMSDINACFRQLIGKYVWNSKRKLGTFLTFEFGEPRLVVREKLQQTSGVPTKIDRILGRRRVFLCGEWHLWVENAIWELAVDNTLFSSEEIGKRKSDADHSDLENALAILDRQIVNGVDLVAGFKKIRIRFDQGAILEFGTEKLSSEPQWSLYNYDQPVLYV